MSQGDKSPAVLEEAGGTAPARESAKIERAYLRLKEDIVSGVYSPNERLVEAPLTRVLEISRNTLRAVLARLQHEGLIVLEPNRGARVRAFTLQEAHEILRVREVLEGLVAAVAAERATDEQLVALRTNVEETAQALADDDLMRYTTHNREFHSLLIEIADNPSAASQLESLHFPLVKYQFQAVLVPGRKQSSLAEHQELLAAIEARDAERAESVARAHIRQVRATLERSEAAFGRTTPTAS